MNTLTLHPGPLKASTDPGADDLSGPLAVIMSCNRLLFFLYITIRLQVIIRLYGQQILRKVHQLGSTTLHEMNILELCKRSLRGNDIKKIKLLEPFDRKISPVDEEDLTD